MPCPPVPRLSWRSEPGRVLAVLGAALLAAPLLAAATPGHATPAHAVPPASATPADPASDPRASTSPGVTLITGDRVHLRTSADGRVTATVDPANRPSGVVPQFHVSTRAGQTYVVPTDVGPLLPAQLDPALFDITLLLEQGFDDASSPNLPVIVSYPDDAANRLAHPSVPAARHPRALPSVTAVAVDVARTDLHEMGSAVFQLAAATVRSGRRAPELSTAQAGPLAGIEKIWLDGRVTTLLDRSTGQISAPAAWDAGFDGSGISIAVLDTGVDDSHPDLAGKVSAARDFTDEADVIDHYGHGTHVASIIAGSGAASDGARRGVAPGADLVNGKVLNSGGSGLFSWIIAGMEWAAGEADADIVNMSLGADPSVFGAELLTQAVENLTVEHDALFVVAAGNNSCDLCINSPGDAASALTVGAVDRDDQLAEFSSRGPAPESLALKPDITAPGVGIMAARAKDAVLGGEGPYLELQGTSMATPHVAGVAALLSQASPGLSPAQLKGALMSTAAPTDGHTVYEQGAGRVDVGRLMASKVLAARGSLDFGVVTAKQGGLDPMRQTLAYRNISEEPITLELSTVLTYGDGAPFDAVTVSPARLTIPPGESGTAEVVLDLASPRPGNVTGHVRARLPDGSLLHTPTGVVIEPERFDLTVSAVARDGRPALPWVGVFAPSPVVDVHTGESMVESCDSSVLSFCVRVPAGTYSVLAFVRTAAAWADGSGDLSGPPLHTTLVGDPEMRVTGDTTVTFDAREAVEVVVDTPAHPRATTRLGGAADLYWARTSAAGTSATDAIVNYPGSQMEERLFVQPMEPVSIGAFTMASRWRLESPAVTLAVDGADGFELDPQYYRMDWFSDNSWQFPTVDGTVRLPLVDAGTARPQDIAEADLDGALALVRRTDGVPVAEQSNAAADAGARMVAIYNDRPGVNSNPGGAADVRLKVPTVRLSHEDGVKLLDRLTNGPVHLRAEGMLASPYLYDLVYAERAGVPRDLHYTADPKDLVRVDEAIHSHLGEGISYGEASLAFQPADRFAITPLRPLLEAPRARVRYHASDPSTQWIYRMETPEPPYSFNWPQPEVSRLKFESTLTSYAPRERRVLSWLRQPLAPGINPQFPVRRVQDWLILGEPFPSLVQGIGLVDGQGHFTTASTGGGAEGITSRFRIWHGDDVIWETPLPPGGFEGVVGLPSAAEQTYRMAFEVDNNSPGVHVSTKTRTEWTFTSTHTETPQPLPLLTLGYDFGVDLDNRMPAPKDRNGANRVKVTVGHQAGVDIPVAGLDFAVSYDDGRSWQKEKVKSAGTNQYTINLGGHSPKGAGFVSFRVSARDAAGNRIDQEVVRAAALPVHGSAMP